MFSQLGLDAPLARAVADQGYTIPTPIQTKAIPALLEGRDVLAAAQTGTGKTAAFALPMLQLLGKQAAPSAPVAYPGTRGSRDARRKVRGLILTPTRELAAQVSQDLKTYGRHMPLRSCVIFGGVGFGPQVDALRRGIDIVVATPGRLLDHVNQRTLDLSGIEIVVLDEADRMLDMGFIHDIKKILAMLPDQAAEPALLGDLLGRHPAPRRFAPADRRSRSRSRRATPRPSRSSRWSTGSTRTRSEPSCRIC